MIPTAFVLGALVGRWWAVPATALAWVGLVTLVGDCGPACWPAAAALASLNAAASVTLRKGLGLVWRLV